MWVRALRITVLKSAGNSPRDECHDLSAEKIQRVKCFMFMRSEFAARQQFSNTGWAGWVRKFHAVVNWRKWRFTSPCPVCPGSRHQAEGSASPQKCPATDIGQALPMAQTSAKVECITEVVASC
jgi:hypothetical protein